MNDQNALKQPMALNIANTTGLALLSGSLLSTNKAKASHVAVSKRGLKVFFFF